MTEARIKLIVIAVAALLLVAVGGGGAWFWQANAYTAIIATHEASRQADLALISNAGAKQAREALDKQRLAEKALADLDRKNTQERDRLNDENDGLRRAVTDGTRRLRIAGSCRAGGSNVPGTASTSGVGDEGAVELSAATGRSVLDIRAGIIADQTAVKALQYYVLNVCR